MIMIDKRINYHIKKYGFKPEVVIVTDSEVFEMKQQANPIHESYFSPLKSEEIYAIAMHEFVCLWDGVKVFRQIQKEIEL